MEDRVSARPLEPEDFWEFRVGQLILLFDVASSVKGHGVETRVLTADILQEVPSLGSAGIVRRLSNARDSQATIE